MRKLILLFLIFVLVSAPVFSLSACLTGTNTVLQNLLSAFDLDVTTSCTSGFSAYDIIVDNVDGGIAGVRAAAKPAILISNEPRVDWDFSDSGDITQAGQTSMSDGSGDPGIIANGIGANPTIYTSGDKIMWVQRGSGTSNNAEPLLNNDVWYNTAECSDCIAVFWWNIGDSDGTGGDPYEQKGVLIGFHIPTKWNDEAKRIFNNSVEHSCPYCFDRCNPPSSGDWVINKTCTATNKDYNITGNVIIGQTGSLNLIGSGGYLNFIGANRFIYIYPGGNLTLDTSATIGKWPPS